MFHRIHNHFSDEITAAIQFIFYFPYFNSSSQYIMFGSICDHVVFRMHFNFTSESNQSSEQWIRIHNLNNKFHVFVLQRFAVQCFVRKPDGWATQSTRHHELNSLKCDVRNVNWCCHICFTSLAGSSGSNRMFKVICEMWISFHVEQKKKKKEYIEESVVACESWDDNLYSTPSNNSKLLFAERAVPILHCIVHGECSSHWFASQFASSELNIIGMREYQCAMERVAGRRTPTEEMYYLCGDGITILAHSILFRDWKILRFKCDANTHMNGTEPETVNDR